MRALLADSCQTILKLGEDLNKSAVNITNEEHVRRLHTVLAAVSSFDYAEISAIGETLRDEKALQYMMEISDKIK